VAAVEAPSELLPHLLLVVRVDVRVAEGVHEVADLEARDLGHHVGEQRVAGDVEGHAQEEVGAALVELAAQPPLGHVELEEQVARRQPHPVELAHVPGADDVPTRVRVPAELFDHPAELIDGLAIGGTPAPPLGAVDRTEVTLLVGPLVPDAHPPFLQPGDVGVAPDEPHQLDGHRLPRELLRRDGGKAPREVEAELAAEHAAGARAGAVRLHDTVVEHVAEQVEVGLHGRV